MKIYLYLIFLLATALVSCEIESDDDDDDDYISEVTLEYTICESSLIKDFNDHNDGDILSTDNIPTALRAHIASEFAGWQLKKVLSFTDENGTTYYGAYIGNKKEVLLFDSAGTFVCGE